MGSSAAQGTNSNDVAIAQARAQADVEIAKADASARKAEADSTKEQYKMYCDLEQKKTELNTAAIKSMNQSTTELGELYVNDDPDSVRVGVSRNSDDSARVHVN